MPEESQLQMFQTLSVWTPCADRNSLGLPPIHLCPSAAPPSNPASHQALFSLTTMSNPSNILAGKNPIRLRRRFSRLFSFSPPPSHAPNTTATLTTACETHTSFIKIYV